MAGVTVFFLRLRPEGSVRQIRIPFRRLQQGGFAGGAVVGHGSLDHVAEAIQLMVVPEICKTPVRRSNGVIGIQIPVRLLGGDHGFHRLIRLAFQLRIRMGKETVSDALQPLGRVAVLKDKAVVLAGFLSGGDAEIPQTAAGLRTGQRVVQREPLIGNGTAADDLPQGIPEGIPDHDLPNAVFRFVSCVWILHTRSSGQRDRMPPAPV